MYIFDNPTTHWLPIIINYISIAPQLNWLQNMGLVSKKGKFHPLASIMTKTQTYIREAFQVLVDSLDYFHIFFQDQTDLIFPCHCYYQTDLMFRCHCYYHSYQAIVHIVGFLYWKFFNVIWLWYHVSLSFGQCIRLCYPSKLPTACGKNLFPSNSFPFWELWYFQVWIPQRIVHYIISFRYYWAWSCSTNTKRLR